MAGWRATQDYLQSTTLRPNGKLVRTNPSSKRTLESRIHWFDNVLERAPEQMWPAVAHPRILDALGAIVGPFAQVDNFTLAAFPSEHEKMGKGGGINTASGFHRCALFFHKSLSIYLVTRTVCPLPQRPLLAPAARPL